MTNRENSVLLQEVHEENYTFVSAASLENVFPQVVYMGSLDVQAPFDADEPGWDEVETPRLLGDHPELLGRIQAAREGAVRRRSLRSIAEDLGVSG